MVLAVVMDCYIMMNESEQASFNYISFLIDTLKKYINFRILLIFVI